MTREVKLALVFGFVVVLVVGVLLSDHLSGARKAQLESAGGFEAIPVAAGTTSEEAGPPVLVLIGEDGKPQPARIAVDSEEASRPGGTAPDAESIVRTASASDNGQILDRLRGQWNTAITELGNGHGPPGQVALDANGGGPLGEPLIPSQDPTTSTTAVAMEPLAFRLYTVKEGDTLWSIASRELGDGPRHRQLAELNRERMGPGGTLRVGASLKIPHKTPATSRVATDATGATPAPEAVQPQSPKRAGTYTVKRGDTLSSIAARTLGSAGRYEDILAANSAALSDEDSLAPGMVLKIPAR